MSKEESLRAAGKVAAQIHRLIGERAVIGANLLNLEQLAADIIAENQMTAPFKGFNGYPNVTCLSVNSEIVHGIPKDYELKNGDILSVDLGVACDDWIVDTARTHIVGTADEKARNLVETTRQALAEALKIATVGHTIGDIGATVQEIVENAGFAVVRELHGHGVGRTLQEPPSIPNYGQFGRGLPLKEGMVLAIEPITTLKPSTIAVEDDGWTIIAVKDVPAAHFEDTIIVGQNKCEILT
ncbi:MAG TPA: type I methionyl aminopeptidase [Candidatus Saccharimonadales bacterium]|nr:type I methionyl aminopeptidase [Candidatus Saccharimonadales bacterium]